MVREAKSIAMELRRDEAGNHTVVLCGDWPELTVIEPGILPSLVPEGAPTTIAVGEDFIAQVGNQRAQYRFMEEDILGNMVCRRIRPAV